MRALVLVLAMSICIPAYAASPTCDEVLSLCDRALNDQLSLSEQQRELILQQKTQIADLSKPAPFYKSPYLWAALAFLGGVYLTKEIRK